MSQIRLEIRLDDATLGGTALVGHLEKSSGKTGDAVSFRYAPSWLEGTGAVFPFALDPQLPLVEGALYARAGANRASPCFEDGAPDRWGRILVGNRDDHLRNHGFLREGNGWRLSPAFDVNPAPDKHDHVLAIDATDTRPDCALLLSTADHYRLKAARARAIADEVRAAVRGWEKIARKRGLNARDIDAMRHAIDPDR